MSIIETALDIVYSRNLPVFPCGAHKRPIISKDDGGRGFHDATVDEDEVRDLFRRAPAARLVGVPTGAVTGFDVLDVDIRTGGDKWLFENAHLLPKTRTHTTLSGGSHLFFIHIPGVRNSASKQELAPGIDVRGDGGYVIYPPSSGYYVADDGPIAEWPDWLLKLVLKRDPTTERAAPAAPLEISSRRLEGLARSILARVSNAGDGAKHYALRNAALSLGGIQLLAGISDEHAISQLLGALPSGVKDRNLARETARWGLEQGRLRPLVLDDRPAYTNGHGNGHAPTEDPPPWVGEGPGHETPSSEEPPADGVMPVIQIEAGIVDTLATLGEEALVKTDIPIFQRGRELVRPVHQEVPASKGRTTVSVGLARVTTSGMVDLLSQAAKWVRWNGKTKVMAPTDPTERIANIILSRVGMWTVPTLAGVIATPTLRPDGTVLHHAGYDPVTRLFQIIDPTLKPAYIPEQPTKQDAEKALATLNSLLDEFPFVAPVDRAVALSALITPIVRGAVGVAPLHAIRASTAGTGKSYLADLASAICSGRPCPVISVSPDPKETESRLTGLLLAGFALISLDNVNGELGGDLLCQAVERPTVRLRRLGGSDIFEVESRATFFATGNGLRVRGDMTRRTLICSLDAGVERPENRDFKHNPIDDVLADRGKYVAAILTIVRAYVVARYPNRCKPLASFEEWSDFVRSPLVWLGFPDPVETTEQARDGDPELTALREFLTTWREAIGGETLALRGAIEIATSRTADPDGIGSYRWPDFREALLAIAGFKGSIDSRRLGKWMDGHEGRIVDGLRLRKGTRDSHSKVARWVVS